MVMTSWLPIQMISLISDDISDIRWSLWYQMISLILIFGFLCRSSYRHTRLDANKLKFLENQFSFTEIIGVRRQRIFATSSEHCNRTGGVAIFVPQSYDDILSICHCEHDPSQIPRFLTILAKLQGHCKVFLSVVYGSPKSNLDSLSQTNWKPHKQIRWLPSHSSRGHQWKTRWLFWLLRNLHNKQHSLWQNNELPWIGRPLRCSWEKPLKKW